MSRAAPVRPLKLPPRFPNPCALVLCPRGPSRFTGTRPGAPLPPPGVIYMSVWESLGGGCRRVCPLFGREYFRKGANPRTECRSRGR